jgi:hypothetical protein
VSTVFSVIVDDFHNSLIPLKEIVQEGQEKKSAVLARVASVNATTLLLAATFEEFIRQMAREYVIQTVKNANSVNELPDDLLETAWRRTFQIFGRSNKANGTSKKEALKFLAKRAHPTINALCKFIEGDIEQNIFEHLIHNENNMGPDEINRLFKVGGLPNACVEACKKTDLKEFFEMEDAGKTHEALLSSLKAFFERRNQIAHSLNSKSSASPDEVLRDICMFVALASDLGNTLEEKIPLQAKPNSQS